MRMVALVVEGRVPAQMLGPYLVSLCKLGGAGAEHSAPALRRLEAHSVRILAPQRNHRRPHDAGMLCNLLLHMGDYQLLTRAVEEAVGIQLGNAGAHTDVVHIVFPFADLIEILFQRGLDKVRSVFPRRSGEVILILEPLLR